MTDDTAGAAARGPWWPAFGLVAAVMALVMFALAALGHRLGVFGAGGAGLLALGAGVLAVIGCATALLGLAIGLARPALAGLRGRLLLTGALTLVVLVPLGRAVVAGGSNPPIHDVSTDTIDPPVLAAAAAARPAGSNAVTWDPAVGELVRATWPDLGPLELPHLAPADAWRVALQAVEARGWDILASDPAAGTIEAAVRTRWFGFTDDVVVRVSPLPGGGSRIDLRSASRVGVSDLGANAARIRALQADLLYRVGGAAGGRRGDG